ncbi:MAG: tRNA dihydrouridine(20/20a) synthase DusA [Burkholderiaceae bacterium]|nr:tRNA dihydrouridine(20/20a) synthase DusA [Burkholderiaceae bacterium]
MMDWTDRHCRFFHRQLSRHARLYTEMVGTGALLHGDARRHLDFDPAEHPLALQLGGSDPGELAHCARLAERWGYDEVNLNCGCPSERVQRGAFGACLMAEPGLVADCVRAMRDAVSIPFVRDFVGRLHEAGCEVFIVHARNAWLSGLSPKENREVPPLRHEVVYRLAADFPRALFVLNGGIRSLGQAAEALQRLHGVMLGRAAYHEPYLLAAVDGALFDAAAAPPPRSAVVAAMSAYLQRQAAAGVPPRSVLRHMLQLFHGEHGARSWRRMLSDPQFIGEHGAQALQAASRLRSSRGAVTSAAAVAPAA